VRGELVGIASYVFRGMGVGMYVGWWDIDKFMGGK
jgi:hypothetical protein